MPHATLRYAPCRCALLAMARERYARARAIALSLRYVDANIYATRYAAMLMMLMKIYYMR